MLLVEANLDVLKLHARGIRNVVAPLGPRFTPDHARVLGRYARHVVIQFDDDLAGRTLAGEALEACEGERIHVTVKLLPGEKSVSAIVNEFVLS